MAFSTLNQTLLSTIRHPILRASAPSLCRAYAIVPPPDAKGSAFQIFDRSAKTQQRDRAVTDVEVSRTVDYVKDVVAARVVDRLLDIKRDFGTVVDLGAGAGHCIKHVDSNMMKKMVMCDMSEKLLNRDVDQKYKVPVERIHVDEELLPFDANSLEAVISSLSLHWVNDLPGAMIQIQRALRPDGVFIGAMFGGDTLFELRTSLQLAELEREGGVSPRVSPLTDVRDIGSLLSRAGFTLTTVDTDDIVVSYPSALELMQDLRAMGESNAILNRRTFLKRDTLLAAAAIYKDFHGNEDGTIPATFSVIYMIGWKPSPTTPKPLKRGSATQSMKGALESGEPKKE